MLRAAVAATILLLHAAPVAAHADLVASTPSAGASLIESPDAAELEFSEPIDPELVLVELLDATGADLDGVGDPEVAEDGLRMRVGLPILEPGTYTIRYQVVSTVDGHATAGSIAFLVDPTGSRPPPSPTPDEEQPAVDAWAITARWAALLGALVAFGSLTAWWRSRSVLPAGVDAPPWRLVAVAGLLAVAGLAMYLWLSSRPIVDAVPARAEGLPFDVAAPFGWTPFAIAMRVALVAGLGTVLIAILGSTVGAARGSRGLATVSTIGALAALGGMAMAAHAAAIGGPVFGLLDLAHLVAAGAWLGALPALVLMGRRGPDGRPITWLLLRRHGAVALVAAPLVVLTGIANSPLVLGATRGLVASEYGNLLLAKALLVSVALGIGAVNHFSLRGRRRAGIATLVGAELVVAALAIGAAAAMVTIQPASSRQPALVSAPVAPAHLFGDAGPTSIHATVDLPVPGSQRYLVTVADAESGQPRDDLQLVFLELVPPAGSELVPARVDLEPADDPRLFTAQGAHLSVVGDWTLDVVVRRSGALDDRASFVVPVTQPTPPQLVPPPDTGIGVPAPIGALWGVLPPGPLAWLLPAAAIGGLALARRWRGAPRARGAARWALTAVAVMAVAAVGTRDAVSLANAPTSVELEDHVPPRGFVGDAGMGEGIYRANCAACHGNAGDGEGAMRTLPAAGPLDEAVARLSSGELSYRIANGLAGTAMPAFAPTLTDEERWHLVHYLETQWR